MRIQYLAIVAMLALLPASTGAQYFHRIGPVDTLTSGNADDESPSIEDSFFERWGTRFTWVLFVRTIGGSSVICGMRHRAPELRWPRDITPISAFRPAGTVKRPGAAYTQYVALDSVSHMYAQRSFRVAAWEQQAGGVWNVWYSVSNDETTWTAPAAVTDDSLDNGDLRVRRLTDSTIIVMWRRAAQLLGVCMTPATASSPRVLAVSSHPDFEYDAAPAYDGLSILWTSGTDSGTQVVAWRRLLSNPYRSEIGPAPADSLTAPDTLEIPRTIREPAIVPWFWSSGPTLMFESDENGASDVFGWSSDLWPEFQNLSNDPESDDRNPAVTFCPIITLKKGTRHQWLYLDVSAYERRASGDSSLVFWPGSETWSQDTVRSEGHNRDVTISPGFFMAGDGNFYYPVVWESNRSGRQHLYGTFVRALLGSADEPDPLPSLFELDQNYPNPFNGATTITVRTPDAGIAIGAHAGGAGSPVHTGAGAATAGRRTAAIFARHATVNIYDVLGRRVGTLYDGPLGPGEHRFTWSPGGVASGVYICRVSFEAGAGTGGMERQIKMLYLR